MIESHALRRAFAAYPTGVTVLAALDETEPVGMAVNSFVSVSLKPPLISVCIAHTSTTWPRIRRATQLGVSVLSASQESVGRRFSQRDVDRFADVAWYATPHGGVLVHGASAWFECSLERTIEAGDHDIGLLRLERVGLEPAASALVFHGGRYRGLYPEGPGSAAGA
ncbi:flavin reductase family protein [Catenulispora sp. GP43]|uniref:flavin reductase family protein n=1 Tax=Catenulispora sp. GP43 TaxID=3156263 RepID=UPI00351520D0